MLYILIGIKIFAIVSGTDFHSVETVHDRDLEGHTILHNIVSMVVHNIYNRKTSAVQSSVH
jgi:hypothetical protein